MTILHAALVIRFELMHFIISLTINWQLTLSWPEQKRGLTRICCQGLWELLDCKNFQLKTSSNIRLWVNLNLCLMRIYTVCFGEPEKIRSHYNITRILQHCFAMSRSSCADSKLRAKSGIFYVLTRITTLLSQGLVLLVLTLSWWWHLNV